LTSFLFVYDFLQVRSHINDALTYIAGVSRRAQQSGAICSKHLWLWWMYLYVNDFWNLLRKKCTHSLHGLSVSSWGHIVTAAPCSQWSFSNLT
jgi:hypothetical protein